MGKYTKYLLHQIYELKRNYLEGLNPNSKHIKPWGENGPIAGCCGIFAFSTLAYAQAIPTSKKLIITKNVRSGKTFSRP